MPRKINYQFIFAVIIVFAAVLIISWSVWGVSRSITVLSASEVKLAARNLMTAQAKLEIVAGLLRGRQYGQWPLSAVPLSEDRGDPFAPNK